MNLKSLRYLVAVADHRHFGKAAHFCNVTQPTLSTQLKKLEDYLGVELIDRTKSEAMPTAVGNEIIALARVILCATDQIRTMANSDHHVKKTSERVAPASF